MSPKKGIAIGAGLLVLGLVVIPAISATLYAHGASSTSLFQFIAYSSFSVICVGMLVSVRSVLNISRSSQEDLKAVTGGAPWSSALWLITRDRSSIRLRVASTIAYGMFLSIVSGVLVIQPEQSFSAIYKVIVPSSALAICCGQIGQMPQLIIYLSDNIGLVITPIALVLLLAVSWLVGLNVNAAVLAHRFRRAQRDKTLISTVGSLVGLFSICPTCAQGLLTAILGASGTVFVTLLASYQGLFVGTSLPLLAVSLIWTAKSISKSLLSACAVPAAT